MTAQFSKYGMLILLANQAISSVNGQVSEKKPNVIIIMTDEQPHSYMGAMGNKNIITPNMDKLAKEGIIFDAAYTPSPICAPARASLMTGRHGHVHEVWDNAAPLRSDCPTFGHSFTVAGYRTVLCGKMHFVGPEQLHGFSERWTQNIYPATFDWTNSNRESIYVNKGQNIDRVFDAGIGRRPDFDFDEEVMFRTENGLRYLNRLNDDVPLMMLVSFVGPHYPFVAPRKYWDMYSDVDFDLPYLPDDFMKNESDHLRWARAHGKFETLVPDSIIIKARRAIYARTTLVDEYIGQIINLLKEFDMYDNTIIVFTSDHGSMMGEHGLWHKNNALEMSARIPLIFSGKGIPSGRRTSEAVSLLDLGVTLCKLANIEMLYPVTDGRDISDLVLNKRAEEEGLAIMENYGEGAKKGYRMIRKGKYKLIYVPGGDIDLYDLENDPGEWTNLAKNPKYKSVVKNMTEIALKGWTDHDRFDEMRYQSEERRIAINKAPKPNWRYLSPPLPHPEPGFHGEKTYYVK